MFKWFWRWLASKADLSGIVLDESVVWEVAPPEKPSSFFEALADLLPPDSVLYLENPIDDEILDYVQAHPAPAPEKVRFGTLWPRPTGYHTVADRYTLGRLAALSEGRPNQDVCFHLVCYRGNRVLLSWYDAWTDPLWISMDLGEDLVAGFCNRLGVAYAKRVGGESVK